VQPLPNQPAVRLSVPYSLARQLLPITERIKQLFDLKADPVAIAATLRRDPELAPLLDRTPGRRIPGCWDGFEIAVRALLDADDPAHAPRLVQSFVMSAGEPLAESTTPAITHLFPTPAWLANAESVAATGLRAALASALAQLARMVVDGTLRFDGATDLGTLRTQLHQLPLLDAATIDRIALRVIGDPDIELIEPGYSDRWRPWRSYAALYRDAL
jgi:AraC family transcriptional regulator of adaptative response / DNA-3-methyladenine glycosylase II